MVPCPLPIKTERGSWDIGAKSLGTERSSRSDLSEKIQNSKKKSLEVLMRLKGLKTKSNV
jgi:hypothetical protein